MRNDEHPPALSGAFHTIRIDRTAPTASVMLARPEVRNALNAQMIAELTQAFRDLGEDSTVRVVVLVGEGKVFSAGADLEWMRQAALASMDENIADALRLADMLTAIRDCPKPVVARVHKAALGGGSGIVAAADITVAEADTLFGFTEARLGLVPSVIAPFVLPRIGVASARELFLTGETFSAERALAIGLIARVAPTGGLDDAVTERVEALLAAAPGAQAVAKTVIQTVWEHPETARAFTTRTIAERRASPEAQAGMAAFLEGRQSPWSTPSEP